MNIKCRVTKLEKWQKETITESIHNPTFAAWLTTMTMDELLFLRDCKKSEEIRTANAAKLAEFDERFNEYQKQNQKAGI